MQLRPGLVILSLLLAACAGPAPDLLPQALDPLPQASVPTAASPTATASPPDPMAVTRWLGPGHALLGAWLPGEAWVSWYPGALAGLELSPAELDLGPQVYARNKLLFTVGEEVYSYDWTTEIRTRPVSDGRAQARGGPCAVTDAAGKVFAYVQARGQVVVRPVDPVRSTQPRVLTDLAAVLVHRPVRGLDLAGDGSHLLVLAGSELFLVALDRPGVTRLALPVGIPEPGGRITAIGLDEHARQLAFTAGGPGGDRLWLYTPANGVLEPIAPPGSSARYDNLRFAGEGPQLSYQQHVGPLTGYAWYDGRTGRHRALVELNAAARPPG